MEPFNWPHKPPLVGVSDRALTLPSVTKIVLWRPHGLNKTNLTARTRLIWANITIGK
jgi:hypothetical protein